VLSRGSLGVLVKVPLEFASKRKTMVTVVDTKVKVKASQKVDIVTEVAAIAIDHIL